MILGFAHLSINIKNTFDEEFFLKNGFRNKFSFINVPNPEPKKFFLSSYSPLHSLRILNNDFLTIELTDHKFDGHINDQITYSDEFITVNVSDKLFFEKCLINGLGFSNINNIFFLKRHLPLWSCKIITKESKITSTHLSGCGPSSLAFYTNNLDHDSKKIIDCGIDEYTENFEFNLGQNDMIIKILKVPLGPFFELIQIKR